MSSDALLSEYDRLLPDLNARGEELVREVRALLDHDPSLKVHSIAWRPKSRDSLARKLSRPDRSYTDLWSLTDLVGLRVVTYFADAVDRVGELVENGLPVDFEHSIDKRRRESNEFGYRSLHYVCKLGGSFSAHARFEVQIRTVLEHAWAEIEHDLGYKAIEEIPLAARRRLSRLAGLLELADQEFGAIRSDLESYARTLPERMEAPGSSVPLDGVSLVALLDHAEVHALDAAIAAALGKDLADEPFYPDYLLRMLIASGVRTTEDARRGARDGERAILAMVRPYFALTEKLWKISPARMGLLPRGYSLFLLAHVAVLRSSTLRLEKIERLAKLYRALDYPDDPKAAHDVASLLVDAFEPIELPPTTRPSARA